MKPLSAGDPAQVGPYRLLGVLGVGGMGRVYLGQSRAGRRVAIKVIRAELAEDQGFRLRFAREVSAARLVSPLYTAAVVDADPDAELPWLATTYIEGPSLEDRVRQSGPMSPAAVLTLAVGLAEALASIHAVGLVHRDLKPSNVLIHDSGPHIIDFGIALADGVPRMTTSLVVGTPSYMAPERIHGSEAGTAGDVFSLGATLVYAATGRSLVHDGTMYAQIMQITVGRFDLSDVPTPLRPLVVRCTSRRPAERPTAEEITRILSASGVAAPAPGWHTNNADPPQVTLPTLGLRMSRRTALILGGAAVTSGAAGIAAWNLRPRSGRPAAVAPTPLTLTPHMLWRTRVESTSLGTLLAGPTDGSWTVVVAGLVVATDGGAAFGIDTDGRQRWRTQLSDEPIRLCPWGRSVVAVDSRRLWVLDPTDGPTSSRVDIAEGERRTAASDNADGLPVQIRSLACWVDTTFLNLGTSMLALRPNLAPRWRTPRAAPVNGRRPVIGNPVVANLDTLISANVQQSTVEIGSYHGRTGTRGWRRSYGHEPSPAPGPPTDGGPGETEGTGDRGGPGEREEAWDRIEGRIVEGIVVLRDAHQIHALRADDGSPLWDHVSRKPVASIDAVGDWVLVGADELRGFDLATGGQQWGLPLRGARLAAVGGGLSFASGESAASDEGAVALLRLDGTVIWQEFLPDDMAEAMPEQVTVEDGIAYVVFQSRRSQPLFDFEVVAYRL